MRGIVSLLQQYVLLQTLMEHMFTESCTQGQTMFLWIHKRKCRTTNLPATKRRMVRSSPSRDVARNNLTNFTIASFSIDFSCNALDPLPREMPRMCSDIFRAVGDERFRTNVFHCSSVTSGGFDLQSSIRPFKRQRVLISIFVMIGATHFSQTPPPFPFMYQSESKAYPRIQ